MLNCEGKILIKVTKIIQRKGSCVMAPSLTCRELNIGSYSQIRYFKISVCVNVKDTDSQNKFRIFLYIYFL